MEYRKIIAKRIAENNPQWMQNVQSYEYDSLAGDFFPWGYGSASTEVVMYSFIAAYTGQNPNTMSLSPFPKIPLPN